jgi:Carboxypeptidase regulatory-like domain/TonB dependent receptor-like, beta-barrel
MTVRAQRLGFPVLCLFVASASAWAHPSTDARGALSEVEGQGAASSITGVVKDSEGGVIPGATVTVTSNATGTKFETVTNTTGSFNVPALSAGVYKVTVALEGFKTAEVTDVRAQPGIPTTVNATLEVGTLAETVTVTGASAELINTQTPAVAATLNVDQIAQIPTPTRDLLLNAVTFLVGVNQATTSRGNATVNGLPESFLNITLDGVSNNDNFNKSTDAFFAPVRPRQDAIEAVSVVSASGGADVGGQGAISINFVTRQGTNRFSGSAYEYYRHPNLNSNYWFNERDGLEKNDVRLNQFGIRQGGPIVIPGLYDGRGKAFFFFHDEELRLPNNSSRVRTLLHPRALEGWFRYSVTAGGTQTVREVNVLDLARANGQIAGTDPTVMRNLGYITSAVQKTGVVSASSDPLLMSYSWLSPANQVEHQPAIRIDYNLGNNHRLTGTFNKLWQDRDPDQLNNFDHRWPDSPNYGKTIARRPSRSIALRSTLSSTMVSEFRTGITRGERIFFGQGPDGGPATFEDQSGYAIDFDANIGLTNWHTRNTLSGRSAYQYSFDETLTWQKGKHSVTMGGGAFLGRAWDDSQQQVTGINLRFDTTNDPASSLFNATNFAGASAAQLTDARELYSLLTGRVGNVTGLAALDPETNTYTLNGKRRRAGKLDNYSAFIQDSWRLTPTLTLNAGMRYDVQTPFAPVNDTMSAATLESMCGMSGLGDGSIYNACNFFVPGASGGVVPQFDQFTSGTRGYNVDWNNFAPNVGVAWRPNVETGWLRTLLGDPEQATIRGGYSVAYNREGFGVFTGVWGANPGSTLSLDRNANTGLVLPGESWPVLLSQTNRLYNAPFPQTPSFPIAVRPNRADSINAFHPDIEVPHARTWTVGLQRSLTKDMALEVRYVGTLGVDQWSELNYNERNLIENGFIDEFKLAMANLQTNNVAGGARLGSFAYFGPGTGTNPLPTYLAYINARRDATNAGAYTGTTWTNTALTQDLVWSNPQPDNSAADLDDDATRRANAAAAGIAANLFVVNPAVDNVDVTDSGAYSDYHALQIEVRKRLSHGFAFNANYQYAVEGTSAFRGFHYGRESDPVANVRHAIKAQWDWSLPFGRGERFGSNLNGVLNGIVSGWQFNGASRIQARVMNFSENTQVRLVGMTAKDLQDMYKYDLRINPANGLLTPYMLPDDVILNTRRAFNVSPTSPTGYSDLGVPEGRYLAPANSADCIQLKRGDCAPSTLLIRAPFFTRVDLGVTKRIPLGGRVSFEFRMDILNMFDNVNFTPVVQPTPANNPGGATIFQATAAYRDPDNTFDPGGRIGQLGFRLNW